MSSKNKMWSFFLQSEFGISRSKIYSTHRLRNKTKKKEKNFELVFSSFELMMNPLRYIFISQEKERVRLEYKTQRTSHLFIKNENCLRSFVYTFIIA